MLEEWVPSLWAKAKISAEFLAVLLFAEVARKLATLEPATRSGFRLSALYDGYENV